MYSKIFSSLLCFFLLGINVSCQSTIKQANTQFTMDDHPVKQLYLSTIQAFNDGNLELFLANFSTDIKMYGTDGLSEGQNALRERFQVVFNKFPNKKMEIPKLSLDILSEEVVQVNFKWKLYPMGQGPAYSGEGSGIYIVRDGKWIETLEVETVTHVDEALRQ